MKDDDEKNKKPTIPLRTANSKQAFDFMTMVNEKQLAKFLGCSTRVLQKWRQKNEGPPYHKVGGKVLYSQEDVLHYIDSRKVIPLKVKD